MSVIEKIIMLGGILYGNPSDPERHFERWTVSVEISPRSNADQKFQASFGRGNGSITYAFGPTSEDALAALLRVIESYAADEVRKSEERIKELAAMAKKIER